MKRFLPIVIFITLLITISLSIKAQSNQIVTNGDTTNTVKFSGTTCTYDWINNTPGIGLAASGSGNIPSFTAINTGSSPIKATISATPFNGEFAYIANNGDNTVSVINTVNNMIVAHLTGFSLPYGVAISPDNSKVYIANIGAGGFISVLNTANNTLISKIPVEQQVTAIAISPDGSRLYASENIGAIAVINTTTNAVRTTITADNPLGLAVSPDGTRLYETNPNSGNVTIVNTANYAVLSVIPVGAYPTSITFSFDGSRAYVAVKNSNYIAVINTASNTVIANIPAGSAPFGEALNSAGTLLYVTNSGSGTVSVINTTTNSIVKNINVGTQPQGISITEDNSQLYVTNSQSNNVSVINTSTNTVTSTLPVGAYPLSFGNFITGLINCNSPAVTFTITVNVTSPPTITVTPATGTISACVGTASAEPYVQQFTVSGNNLTSSILITAPAGFEISQGQESGYGNTANLDIAPAGNGSTVTGIVYVRSSASAPAGNISGNVVLTSPGAVTQNVAVSGIVNALPTVNTISNQTLTNGSATAAVNFTGTGNTFTWVNDTPGIGLAASGTGNISSFTAVNPGSSPVTATVTVTPKNAGYAYVANFTTNNVSVINTGTNSVIKTISVGVSPIGTAISPDGGTVYVTNSGSNTISVINAATNTVTATIKTPGGPAGIAISPDGTKLYVAIFDFSDVLVINTTNDNIISTLGVGQNPEDVVLSADGNHLYVSNTGSNTITAIDISNNYLTTNIAVGINPYGIAVSSAGDYVYVANYGSNNISIINTANNTVVSTINVGNDPRELAISPDGNNLYVTNKTPGTVTDYNTKTNTITSVISVGSNPTGINITKDGSIAYVTNQVAQTVSVINLANNVVTNTIPVDGGSVVLGDFINGGPGCDGLSIKFTITVNPSAQPLITSSGTINSSNTVYGTPSSALSFTVSGNNLTAGILVTPPAGFEVSTDGINFSNTITVGSAAGTVPSTTVYIRLAATTPVNNYSGNVVLSSSNATNVNVNISNSIVTPAALNITANTVHKEYGATLTDGSGSIAFTSTGLQNNETVGSVTINYGAGSQANAAVNTYSSSVTPSSPTGGSFNATNYTITYIQGDIIIDPTALTITANNQTKTYGTDNPELTISYTGFVNNDNVSVLTVQPIISTTATTASPAGQYPITVSGAETQNYDITYISGLLTIVPANIQLVIPNTFTPNGDGINDTWIISYIEYYPNATVNIFNRYGEKVLTSIGYGVPWDGTYKGVKVPSGTYYYIIDPKNGHKPISGWIAVIR